MLIITRKSNEKVIIDNKIEVTVSRIRYNEVRLSFKAPKEIKIWREEINGKQPKEKTFPSITHKRKKTFTVKDENS